MDKAIKTEVDFWENIVKNEFHKVEHWFDPDSELQDKYKPFVKPDSKLIDIGAALCTKLGKNLNGQKLDITAVDLLADTYNLILAENKIIPPIETIAGKFEMLEYKFGRNAFDFVYTSNALDHCANPGLAIWEMIKITKPGGTVYIEVNEYEADRNRGEGLHKWNFIELNGDVLIEEYKTKEYRSLKKIFGINFEVIKYEDVVPKLDIIIKRGGENV